MLCRRMIYNTAQLSLAHRNFSFVKKGDPDMSRDKLFDENFEVREKEIYIRKFIPSTRQIFRYKWLIFRRIAIWFGGQIPEIKSQEECDERAAIMYRLEECYLEIPQVMPDRQWFHDLIDHYTKYNDYGGALHVWQWLHFHDAWVNVDQEVIDKFDRFFEINDPKSLTLLSDHQKKHQLQLHKKFLKMDNNPERFWKRRKINIDNAYSESDRLPEGDRTGGAGGW